MTTKPEDNRRFPQGCTQRRKAVMGDTRKAAQADGSEIEICVCLSVGDKISSILCCAIPHTE